MIYVKLVFSKNYVGVEINYIDFKNLVFNLEDNIVFLWNVLVNLCYYMG